MNPVGKVLRAARRRRNSKRTLGSAVVEFAVVLPLLLMILFGIIEYGWVFMVRLTLQNAAREGCRVAVLQTTTTPYTEVTNRIDEIIAPTGVSGYTVTMKHASLSEPTEEVTISIPYQEVSLLGVNGFLPGNNYDIVATCSMRKEGMGATELEDS